MSTVSTTLPTSVSSWVETLPQRDGWTGWDNAGQSVYEGVRNASAQGDDRTAVSVWGNVVEVEDGEPFVNWCLYVGDCVDPQRSGFESAEAAMDAAERGFPELFA